MEDLNVVNKRQHKINMINRRICNLTGIVDVIAFDVGEILLETDMGILMMKGNDLHVKRLNLEKGELDVEGRVDSMTYSEHADIGAKSESFFSRLFR